MDVPTLSFMARRRGGQTMTAKVIQALVGICLGATHGSAALSALDQIRGQQAPSFVLARERNPAEATGPGKGRAARYADAELRNLRFSARR